MNSEEKRCSFELFKSNVCHKLKRLGDINFLIDMLKSDEIRYYANKEWWPECLYLLAMVDYISDLNHIEQCIEYNDLRCLKLSEPIYPASVLAWCFAAGNDTPKEKALKEAIPEFLQYNIIEGDIRDVY